MDARMADLTSAAALSKKLREDLESVNDIRTKTDKLETDADLEARFKVKENDDGNDHDIQLGQDHNDSIKDVPDKSQEILENQQKEVDDLKIENVPEVVQLGQDHKESVKDVPDKSQDILEKAQKEVIELKTRDCKENVPVAVQEKLQNLGDMAVAVSSTKLNNCNHTTATKLTTDLLSLVFTKKELATSSMTGKVGNMHLGKITNTKMQLDVAKVAAVKSYVKSKFPTVEKLESVINKAIQQKCCNAAKSMMLIANTNNATLKE